MDILDFVFNDLLVNPMINIMITVSNVLFDTYGLAIIAFTLAIRLVTYPLTLRQLRTTRSMQEMQPRLQEIQKKYKDPKRRQQEMMKLYREVGFNPLGCAVPLLVQMPIWIALFWTIRRTLGSTPEALIDLSSRLYDWSYITEAVPLNRDFLFLDLANPSFPLAILVGIATFYQQKLSSTRSASRDDRQASMNRTMLIMLPLLFAWFTFTVPSGLGLYWLVTSLFTIVMSYLYHRPKHLTWRWAVSLDPMPSSARAPTPARAGAGAATAPVVADTKAEQPSAEASSGDGGGARRRRRRRRRRRPAQSTSRGGGE